MASTNSSRQPNSNKKVEGIMALAKSALDAIQENSDLPTKSSEAVSSSSSKLQPTPKSKALVDPTQTESDANLEVKLTLPSKKGDRSENSVEKNAKRSSGKKDEAFSNRFRVDIHIKGKNHKFPGHYSLKDKNIIHEWARIWKGKVKRGKNKVKKKEASPDELDDLGKIEKYSKLSVMCLRKNQEPQRWTQRDAFQWFEQKSNPSPKFSSTNSKRRARKTKTGENQSSKAAIPLRMSHASKPKQGESSQHSQNNRGLLQGNNELSSANYNMESWQHMRGQTPAMHSQSERILGKRSIPPGSPDSAQMGVNLKAVRHDLPSAGDQLMGLYGRIQEPQLQLQQHPHQLQQHHQTHQYQQGMAFYPNSMLALQNAQPRLAHNYFSGVNVYARHLQESGIKSKGKLLAIHPNCVDYVENVSTLVQVEWTAPIQYLDTKPVGWRIHFLTLNNNFGTFDAKGLPPGDYMLGDVLFRVESAYKAQSSSELGKEIEKEKVDSKPEGGAKTHSTWSTNNYLVEAKAKLLLVAPCYSSVVALVRNEHVNLSSEGVQSAFIDLNHCSVFDPLHKPLQGMSSLYAPGFMTALAWASVQRFFQIAGKVACTLEDAESFLKSCVSSSNVKLSSVTVFDVMKPLDKCVVWQSPSSFQVYGDLATETYRIQVSALTALYRYFVESRCQDSKILKAPFRVLRERDSKTTVCSPVMVSSSKWFSCMCLFYWCQYFSFIICFRFILTFFFIMSHSLMVSSFPGIW